jgi:two-component system cell cycle sensor histidine kinase/response regulator CckA
MRSLAARHAPDGTVSRQPSRPVHTLLASRLVTRTVLVVEDAEDVRRFFTACVEGAGYRVLCAESVHEALSLLRAGNGVDLILADYVLGDGTGVELIHQASNEGHLDTRVTPTLICTAYRYVELPPDVRIVRKPIDPSELLRQIAEALVRCAVA